MEAPLKYSNPASWVETVWEALDQERHTSEQWDDICTAMAWISEELGLNVLSD